MVFRPIGMYQTSSGIPPVCVSPADFSTDAYEGIQMRKTTKGDPVVIMRSKKPSPMAWIVQFGFSKVFFKTLADAVEFCNSRGMEIMQRQ